MIPVKDIWNRIKDYAKKHQSGLDTVSDFNGKLKEVQNELTTSLVLYFEDNDRIKGLFNPFIKPINEVTGDKGIIDLPERYYKHLSSVVNGREAYPANMNEIKLMYRIPQRKPSIEKGKYYFLSMGKTMVYHPKEAGMDVEMTYIQFPPEAKIAFDYEEDEESGELVMAINDDETIDLEWNMDAFNLIVYSMLEKYGITSRELILQEYAQLGIKSAVQAAAVNIQEVGK